MIIVKISGGLGNQLFKLNKSLELYEKGNTIFLDLDQYSRDRFDREYHFYKKIPKLKILNKSIKKVLIKTNKITQKIGAFEFYEEKINDITSENLNDIKKISYLSGSWEENTIPTTNNLNILRSLFKSQELKDENKVCVHFRTKNYDIKLHKKYYENSISEFDKSNEFHIYGDDKKFLTEEASSIFKDFNFKIIHNTTIQDFEEIMTYQNYISSNSTYSWWSIFLNQNKILKVTTPRKWMNQPYEIFRPSTWKIISN
tara:strand:+ start:28316 stop:29086 length:771 start_codon:yes stop_codon:yes gene_type:complete